MSERYRVIGPLPPASLADASDGTAFVRNAFDLRARAILDVRADGLRVWHEGFKSLAAEWRETPKIRREFHRDQTDEATRYFNSLLLSPGYIGPSRTLPMTD